MATFNEIQDKWQKRWEEGKIFKTNIDSSKPKFYCLEMFSYPSGKLHMGHVRNYSLGDSVARFKRMTGHEVLYPVGFDAFGLPAENAAIKNKIHPGEWTEKCMADMVAQLKSLGFSYDFDNLMATCRPDYYKWNQYFFLKMFERGLVYKKTAIINWCPSCATVLANEQVENGKCWRCKSEVEEKSLEQWFIKITDYAEELLEDVDKLEHWPERVRTMQRNWIGKSYGTEIFFDVVDEEGNKIDTITTFTTRPDTIYGVTYLVLAVEHPKVIEWTKNTEYESQVKEFITEVKKKSVIERTAEGKEKNGMFIGKYFINPVNGEKLPLWVADYALYDYGTGAVMAVPTHDQRDFEFAKKYNLPLKVVINPKDGYRLDPEKMGRAFMDEGILVNSGDFDGTNNREAIEDVSKFLEEKNWGKRTVNFKLRDWLISRQRYWGTPIPVVYCDDCGAVPVPESELPVELPKDVEFTGNGNPLETSESFRNVKCPKCGGSARRETDTMDTFFDSSWYFFRYIDPFKEDVPFDKYSADKWLSVDQYIGGIEHAVGHLMYARFFTKFLRDLGLTDVDEPASRLLCQGMVIKDGSKMSKSLGNTVDPAAIIEQYGSDTARLFILFTALPEKELDWSDQGVAGSFRFLKRVLKLAEDKPESEEREHSNADRHIIGKMHRTLQKVTELLEDIKPSLAIGALMEYVNAIYRYSSTVVNGEVYDELVEKLTLMIVPFAPHIAEEMWEMLGKEGLVSLASWPEFDESRIDVEAEASEEMVHSTVSDIRSVLELTKIENPKKLTLFVSAPWKYDFFRQFKIAIEETRNPGDLIKKFMSSELRVYGQEITKLIPRLIRDTSKVPDVVLGQEVEFFALEGGRAFIAEEFGCDVKVIRADESDHKKAKQASPGKPAIVVE